ncbi:MAG: hypothetical protein JO022_18555 [Acidobacteriaceae bacterium]|nr:hypothetical protein [Acidobacteriaceae bacterium]
MSPSTAAINSARKVMPSPSSVNTPAFWERLWLTSGVQFTGLLFITCFIYGGQPGVGVPSDAIAAFYTGDRTRILIAVVFAGLNILNLMWFAAALRTTLADAGQDGWGAAATASSAAFGGIYLLFVSVVATLAYSIAGSGNNAVTSALHDFSWALVVLSSFPRAMLIMAGTFGLWRAGLISNALFGAGVAAVVLGVLGGTTWINGGLWAPDGAYSRFIFPTIGIVWIVVVTRVLLSLKPTASTSW